MNRRNFLKSLGAIGLAPAIQLPAFAASPVITTIPTATYKWAETIVRAHKTCNLAMLQRHLRLDAKTASFLQSQLINNGVISAQANAYGIRAATNPMFDGLYSGTDVRTNLEQDTKVETALDDDAILPDVFELNDRGELIADCPKAQVVLNSLSQSVQATHIQ